MRNPLISVIVPIYNVKPYLERCLNSIISQTYRNLDIILVDDGSTDGSSEICDIYRAKDSRIMVIHKQNGGPSDARNYGLEKAKGDLISFIDSDDWIDLDLYEILIQVYLENNSDIIIFGLFYVSDTLELSKSLSLNSYSNKSISKEDAINLLIEDNLIKNYICNKLYTKKVFNNIEFPYGKLFEDIHVMHKLFLNSNIIFLLDSYKYYYYFRTTSITKSKKIDNDIEEFRAYYSRYKDLKDLLFINQTSLFIKILHSIIDLYSKYPFILKIKFKQELNIFNLLNKTEIQKYKNFVTRRKDKIFFTFPYFIFIIIYNPYSVKFRKFIKSFF